MALRNENFTKDAEGRLFFDRNPLLFAKLFDLLRDHPTQRITLELAKEADYYGLPFKQNCFAIDTLDGEIYLPHKDYTRFICTIGVLEWFGPNGHGFFPCTKKQMQNWTYFNQGVVDLESYLFWVAYGKVVLPDEFSLLVGAQWLKPVSYAQLCQLTLAKLHSMLTMNPNDLLIKWVQKASWKTLKDIIN